MSKKLTQSDSVNDDKVLPQSKAAETHYVTEKTQNDNSKNISVIIGANIRRERISRGFSIDLLAELLSLSAPFVGLIERGERGTTVKNLMKICEVFDTSLNDLVSEYEPEHAFLVSEKKSAPKTKKEEKLEQLRSLLANMDENELDFLVSIAKEYHMLRYKMKNSESL